MDVAKKPFFIWDRGCPKMLCFGLMESIDGLIHTISQCSKLCWDVSVVIMSAQRNEQQPNLTYLCD